MERATNIISRRALYLRARRFLNEALKESYIKAEKEHLEAISVTIRVAVEGVGEMIRPATLEDPAEYNEAVIESELIFRGTRDGFALETNDIGKVFPL